MKRFSITLKMVIHTYLRSRSALVFGLVFPALLYILYGYIFQGTTNVAGGGKGNVAAALWLMPSVITLSIVLMGISGTVQMVLLRSRGVFRVMQATPMPAIQYLLALVITQLILVAVQVVLAVLVGGLFFHVYPQAGGWYIDVLVILAGAAVFITLGQLIAIVAPQMQTANILNQSVNLTTIFFGNLFLPLSTMPEAIQEIGRFLPGFLIVDLLRPAIVTGTVAAGTTWNSPLLDLAGLGLYLVVFLVLTARFFRWT
ncbi:MAG: ABC transporter permease [Ktedonobacterales bacterium]